MLAASARRTMRTKMSASHSILVVEDEPLIAMMLEDFLETLGHTVHASCESVDDAIAKAEEGGFDVAIVDVNLNGETAWPVARKLREKSIPFVIATGGHVEPPPSEFADVPTIDKPYTVDRVTPALDAAMGR
jgi:CheY-like chemotaxis protein